MPYKAKHPCRYPGCNKLADGSYCEKHKKEYNREYDNYHRGYKHSSRYNAEWHRIRTSYVKNHPLCEECLKAGKFVPVDVVHHVMPIADGGENKESNLISLCNSCHMKKHSLLKE